ncbi:stage II sporulation protein P [Clostridium psychrophilum]|uniref:stage II sporulation protein P n=1 Tax=Clostridium psychrophilum TaxID=132926 RepID=UPI001C0D4E00|nr:stage II sporulation protein P [Clostridium psychrophilum]MBU3182571.1 stage II sporulation protein P [Clostridium psychrophilum]
MSYKGIKLDGNDKNISNKKMNILEYLFMKNGNVKIFFCTFTLLIIFFIGLILPRNAKAVSEGDNKNSFYINVMNNVLSAVKSSSTKLQEDNSEDSMNAGMLSFLGIDISNPISIVVKEIAYLDKSEGSTDTSNSETFSLNPFNLDDKQVSKSDTKASNVVANLYNPSLKTTLNKTKPRVLIYHSHTSEAYRTSSSDASNTKASLDKTRNVCAVGDIIADELENKYGISVIHDKNVNDTGDYNNAYKKSGVTLDKYLKKYGKFDLIIDLHRDSITDNNAVTTKINGEKVAKFMFVVTDKNPNYARQKKLINSMITISNKLYPGFARSNPIYYYHWGMGFYNQNRSNNAMLIEAGTYTNTVKEVKNTGKYLSRVIAEQLNGKK